MGIFDLFSSIPKIDIILDKEIYEYGDKIIWKIIIESKKSYYLKTITLKLDFTNDSLGWLDLFIKNYNRKKPSIDISIMSEIKPWIPSSFRFEIDSPNYFNKEDIIQFFKDCENNPNIDFNWNILEGLMSFSNPMWKIKCDELKISKDIRFSVAPFEDVLNKYI